MQRHICYFVWRLTSTGFERLVTFAAERLPDSVSPLVLLCTRVTALTLAGGAGDLIACDVFVAWFDRNPESPAAWSWT